MPRVTYFQHNQKSEAKAGDGEGRNFYCVNEKKIVELFYDLVGFATFVCVRSSERLGPPTNASNVISDIVAGTAQAGRSMWEASCGWKRIKDREASWKHEKRLKPHSHQNFYLYAVIMSVINFSYT